MSKLSRRGLITGLIALVAAPAIVRAGSLMPVKTMVVLPTVQEIDWVKRYLVKVILSPNGEYHLGDWVEI